MFKLLALVLLLISLDIFSSIPPVRLVSSVSLEDKSTSPGAAAILGVTKFRDLFSFGSYSQAYQSNDDKVLRCGQPMAERRYRARIVDGKRAPINDFPWMVSIQREKGFWFGFKAFYHSCGGSLLTQSWIITAAHCMYNREEPLRIIAGTDNLNLLYRAQIRSVGEVKVHPNFDSVTFDNDIALIKVSKAFKLESSFSRVGAICLERDIPIVPYDIATICGFGAKAFQESSRTHLYKTDIAIIDQLTCNSSFEQKITDNMICAGGMVANKRDACSGDSGGPLQIENEEHYSLIGVVSFGNDCAARNYPGIYTKLENYYDWILENIDEPLIKP